MRLNGIAHQRNRRERPVCRSAPERTEPLPKILENVPTLCHSDRSVSGVEESTTLDNEPPQDKICNSGRFLDSLCSLGMTCRWVVPFIHTGYNRHVPGTVSVNTRYVPLLCHSDRSEAEWRNPPRWIIKQHKIKLATWEDSSTRCAPSE